MKLSYALLDPSGNVTVLVTSPVPRPQQAAIAAGLLEDRALRAEQVGFLEAPTLPGARARLQMMGGEFCGNASMSLAALLARSDGLAIGSGAEFALEVSGANGIVRCSVERASDALFRGVASMPLPEYVDEVELPDGRRAPLVRFPGIAHLIVSGDALSRTKAEAAVARLCEQLDLDALGILLTGADGASMRPLVYVRATQCGVWERGCGSGTAALGALAALRAGRSTELSVAQPGGTIAVRADFERGALRAIEIRGSVRLVADGSIII